MPSRHDDENTRTCWDYTFQLTPEHPTPEEMDALKRSYDKLADAALERLNALEPPPKQSEKQREPASQKPVDPLNARLDELDASPTTHTGPEMPPAKPAVAAPSEKAHYGRRDLYALLRDNAGTDPVLGELWTQLTTVPDWVDWDQIGRGQDVFYRYGGACLAGLGFQSLLGGMGAARVVETLTLTGGFAGPMVRHRLLETTQHVLEVTGSVRSLQPPAIRAQSGEPASPSHPGDGFASTVRVRLLHAAVRSRILALAAESPEYYSVARHGVPINDLDNAGTALTFSATLLFLALPRQGIRASAREAADYVALWRYVAHLIGAPTEPLRSPAAARRWMEVLLLREVAPSPTGRVLAHNIVAGLANRPPTNPSPEFLVAQARWLNGHKLCDALDLPRPHVGYTLLVAAQCGFFVLASAVGSVVPGVDAWRGRRLRALLWEVFVVRKDLGGLGKPALFHFKYRPSVGKNTAKHPITPRAGLGSSERRSLFLMGLALLMAVPLAYVLFVGHLPNLAWRWPLQAN